MIPKIIHHIAPKFPNTWHCFWHKCYDSWKKHFLDYEFMFWNDKDDIDNFVKTHYKEHFNLYKNFPFHIMRIDFARLCILHKFGGIYADMDVFCYKNFEHLLTKEIYFLENTTHEYTSAIVENSLMASIAKHRFFEETMRYVKCCFINFRNSFDVNQYNWRSEKNDNLINNTTGSGMLEMAFKHYGQFFNLNKLECELFNNRPCSYSENFYTKHVHTSIWGNEYIKKLLPNLLLLDGILYNIDTIDDKQLCELKKIYKNVQIIPNEEFCFYTDYTDGNFLNENNLQNIKEIVVKRH
jgi:mannosyltransferase OCH1-like enzyme